MREDNRNRPMPFRYTLLALAFLASSVQAQTPGSCSLGTATSELSASDVRASLATTGRLFSEGGSPGYEVPLGGGVHAFFAAHLWFGGQVGGDVRTSASIRSDVQELWPGPLDDGAALPDADDCSAFDRIYRVSTADVAAYDAGGAPTADLADWPVGLGAPAVDANGDAVVPTDRAETVDLAAGERPVLYGAETAFWVMNDVGNEHTFSATPPLGIEVRVSAFAVSAPAEPALDRATFYRIETVNRSAAPIEDFRLGLWADVDLGDASDDYVGSDAEREMLYVYNADDDDAGGYGTAPPALGVDILSGAAGAGFHYKNSLFLGEPQDASWIDAYLRSQWQDGTPLTRGGDGYQDGGEVTTWIWDGEPETQSFWSETDIAPEPGPQPNDPQDRRAFISATPTTLAPGAASTVDIGIVYARGTDHLDSVAELRAASDVVQARYDDGSLFEAVLVADEPAPTAGVRLDAPHPNPTRGDASVGFALDAPDAVRIQIVDALGRTVAVLTDRSYHTGPHRIEIGASLTPGVYSLVMDAGGTRTVRRLTVVR